MSSLSKKYNCTVYKKQVKYIIEKYNDTPDKEIKFTIFDKEFILDKKDYLIKYSNNKLSIKKILDIVWAWFKVNPPYYIEEEEKPYGEPAKSRRGQSIHSAGYYSNNKI